MNHRVLQMRLTAPIICLLAMSFTTCALAGQMDAPAPPGPPIVKLPLAALEPSRTVAAALWNSRYCGNWDDGCTECTRQKDGDAAQCRVENISSDDGPVSESGECKRRAIICFKEIDKSSFDKMCHPYMSDRLLRGKSGTYYAEGTFRENTWEIIEGRWQIEVANMSNADGVTFSIELDPTEWAITDKGYVAGLNQYDSPRTDPFGKHVQGVRCLKSYYDLPEAEYVLPRAPHQ
jgi:hypothetical protein